MTQQQIIPAASGVSLRLNKGEKLRIIDIEGGHATFCSLVGHGIPDANTDEMLFVNGKSACVLQIYAIVFANDRSISLPRVQIRSNNIAKKLE